MSFFHSLTSSVQYYWNSKTKFDIHSPFVFEFATQVLEDDRYFYDFEVIEDLRDELLSDSTMIAVHDSKRALPQKQKIKTLTKALEISALQGQFLFRLTHHYQPKVILDIGTGFGIKTLYQATASYQHQVITLEENPALSKVAQQNFQRFSRVKIKTIIGGFEEKLPSLLPKLNTIDCVFLDMSCCSPISLFEICLPFIHNDTIFVLNHIHASPTMNQIWQTLQQHTAVTFSIDVFQLGLLFFRKEMIEKQDFVLIDSWLKPWRLGFWK